MKDTNIYQLVPDGNSNWKVKNDMIYYHRYCDIPLLSVMDGRVWVCLDRRVTRPFLKLVRHLVSMKIPFFMTERFLIHKKFLVEGELERIIRNYLNAITDERIFDGLAEIGFDFISNLTDFMVEYGCLELLGPVANKVKSKYLTEWTDWYTGLTYPTIKREDIRDVLSAIDREIKLNLLI